MTTHDADPGGNAARPGSGSDGLGGNSSEPSGSNRDGPGDSSNEPGGGSNELGVKRLGLVVNPVAGIGGPTGLKGSDGAAVQDLAVARGATPRAIDRTVAALRTLARIHPRLEVLTADGVLGADAVTAAGLTARVVTPGRPASALTVQARDTSPSEPADGPAPGESAPNGLAPGEPAPDEPAPGESAPGESARGASARLASASAIPHTTAADTVRAARALRDSGADLLLFTGGDGTARDVSDAIGETVPVLGIPAGVKMYSGCFAVSPAVAGTLAADWLDGRTTSIQRSDVLDIDEDAIRLGRAEPRLHGTVRVPVVVGRTQSRKTASPISEAAAVRRAAAGASVLLRPGVRYLLGPGGTMRTLAELIAVPKTPLGFDVVESDGVGGWRLVHADADETALLAAVDGHECQAVVTVIGGQGFLLGRGNQQLSCRVLRAIRAVSDQPLLVAATEDKLTQLGGLPLLVDTGDADLDRRLSGYARVVTGPGASSLYPVHAPEQHTIDP